MERAVRLVASREFLLACFFLFLINAAFFKVSDVDVGFHIRTGELIWHSLRIPSENTFSYTHEHHPWLLHQWLPTILIYAIDQIGGYRAIILATVAVATAVFAFVCAAGLRRSSSASWVVCFLTIGLMAARFRFNMRPDLFSGMFFAIFVWHLARIKMGAKPNPWLIIGLLVLWANSHAGYVYGMILLGAFSVGELLNRLATSREPGVEGQEPLPLEFLRRLILYAGVGLVASVASVWLINPNGPRVLLLPFQFFTDKYYMSIIAEYARATPSQYPWFCALVVLGGGLMLWRWRRLDWSDVLPFVAFAYLGFAAVRNILFFVLVAVPVAAGHAEPIGRAFRARFPSLERIFRPSAVHLLFLCGFLWLYGTRVLTDATYQYGFGLYPGFYPTALFEILKSPQVQGNVFNEMQWGGPMLWRVGPQRKVFIDGRLEAYEESFWKQTYEPVYFGEPLWVKAFAEYHIQAALVHYGYNMPKPKMLAHQLAEDPDWALVGWTEQALLYLQRIPEHAAMISSNEFSTIKPLAPNLDYITPQNAPQVLAETGRMHRHGEDVRTSWVLTGRAWLVLGDYQRAAQAYEMALRSYLPAPLAQRDLAFAYVQLKRYREAERLLRHLPRDEVNTELMKQIREKR